jgi:glycerol kinase
MAYQTYDVLSLMQKEAGITFDSLNVDGGASANNLLLQIQANILGAKIIRPACIETTALGAAYLAGLATGAVSSTDEIIKNRYIDKTVEPDLDDRDRQRTVAEWHRAVDRSRSWVQNN